MATTLVLANMTSYGPETMPTQCPNCDTHITTEVKAANGGLTWLVFGLFCILGCWAGCCLIPFCCSSCRNVEHYCPNCKTFLGVYKRM